MQTIINRRLYYAGRGFVYRGIWLWAFKRNTRIIPFNRFANWAGRER